MQKPNPEKSLKEIKSPIESKTATSSNLKLGTVFNEYRLCDISRFGTFVFLQKGCEKMAEASSQ